MEARPRTVAPGRTVASRRTARQVAGALAEEAVAGWLAEAGWTIVVRNLRIGRSEVDIVARDPSGTLVLVEVRSRSGPALGMPEESVDRAKVVRLYAAAWRLLADGGLGERGAAPEGPQPFRVDLVTVVRGRNGGWQLRGHMRGLEPS